MKHSFYLPFTIVTTLLWQIFAQTPHFDKSTLSSKMTQKNSEFVRSVTFEQVVNNNFNKDYLDYSDYTKTDTFDDPEEDSEYVPVMALMYYGNWNSTISLQPGQFNFFSETSGYAKLSAYDKGDDNIDDTIYVVLFNGQFTDQKAVHIKFKYENATDFNPSNSTFKNANITFNISFHNNNGESDLEMKTCVGSYQLSYIDSITNTPYQSASQDYENAIANLWLESEGCEIAIFVNVAVENSSDESKALEYAIMVTLICVLHIYACMQIVRTIAANELDGTRYSLISMSIFAGWDIFLCLYHFYGALTTEVFFHYFITPAFWYFILASILEARLLLIIWKAKYYHNFQTIEEVRGGLTAFYSKFYIFLAVFLLLAYTFLPDTWFFYATSFFFVPQIVHNAMRGQKYKFDSSYVLLLGALRMFIPIYMKGYSASAFRFTPSSGFPLYYAAIIMSQILFLFLQSKVGSRFFVPSCFLPTRYNYFIKMPANIPLEEMETCSICMDSLGCQVAENSTRLLNEKVTKSIKIMKTPCNHQFHEKCLKDWMDIKLDCPFCRTELPALD